MFTEDDRTNQYIILLDEDSYLRFRMADDSVKLFVWKKDARLPGVEEDRNEEFCLFDINGESIPHAYMV